MAGEKNDIVYRDTGCHIHPNCLTCPEVPPLSMCIFDFPGYETGWRQYKQIKYYLLIEHLSIAEIAVKMNMRKRTIEQILAKVEKLVLI